MEGADFMDEYILNTYAREKRHHQVRFFSKEIKEPFLHTKVEKRFIFACLSGQDEQLDQDEVEEPQVYITNFYDPVAKKRFYVRKIKGEAFIYVEDHVRLIRYMSILKITVTINESFCDFLAGE